MKKYLIFFTVAILMFLVLFIFAGCGDPCKTEEAQDYIDDFDKSFEEFKDTFDLADSTARIALTPVISEMQAIKRELNGLDLPEGCDKYKDMQDYSVETMEKAIEAFMKFQQQEDEFEVINMINGVETRFEYIEKWIVDIEESFK